MNTSRKLKPSKYGAAQQTAIICERGCVALMNAGDQKTRDRDAEEICRRFNLFPELARTLADLLADHVAMSKRKVILTGGGHLQGLTWKPLLIQERAQKVVAAAFDVEI